MTAEERARLDALAEQVEELTAQVRDLYAFLLDEEPAFYRPWEDVQVQGGVL